MMEWAKESLEKLEASRLARLDQPAPQPDSAQAEALLKQYHPDYLGHERTVGVGPNAGKQKFPFRIIKLL